MNIGWKNLIFDVDSCDEASFEKKYHYCGPIEYPITHQSNPYLHTCVCHAFLRDELPKLEAGLDVSAHILFSFAFKKEEIDASSICDVWSSLGEQRDKSVEVARKAPTVLRAPKRRSSNAKPAQKAPKRPIRKAAKRPAPKAKKATRKR